MNEKKANNLMDAITSEMQKVMKVNRTHDEYTNVFPQVVEHVKEEQPDRVVKTVNKMYLDPTGNVFLVEYVAEDGETYELCGYENFDAEAVQKLKKICPTIIEFVDEGGITEGQG